MNKDYKVKDVYLITKDGFSKIVEIPYGEMSYQLKGKRFSYTGEKLGSFDIYREG